LSSDVVQHVTLQDAILFEIDDYAAEYPQWKGEMTLLGNPFDDLKVRSNVFRPSRGVQETNATQLGDIQVFQR